MQSLVGGSAVPESLICAFAKRGATIKQAWGMTETSAMATMLCEKQAPSGLTNEQWFARKALGM